MRECRKDMMAGKKSFDEYECGHGMPGQCLVTVCCRVWTGVRYDAVDKTMYIDSNVGDFKSFISTATGFGTIELKEGKPSLHVVHGKIDVREYNISGKIVKL